MSKKEAFYFPHYCGARHDRKIRRLRKDLGIEGYGIFFMLLEVLREQTDFKYPLDDLDLLADEIKTSEAKIQTVIKNYGLFHFDSEENFFSAKLVIYLKPYLDTKHRNKINGIKGNLIKYGHCTKEDIKNMSDFDVLNFDTGTNLLNYSGGDSGGDRKDKRGEERRREENNKKSEFLELFDKFRKKFPGTKKGNETEFKNFTKKHKDWKEVINILESSLDNQIEDRKKRSQNNQFVPPWKHLATWINQRCWEEETIEVAAYAPVEVSFDLSVQKKAQSEKESGKMTAEGKAAREEILKRFKKGG